MFITYLGHSCFYIKGEKSVVTDPFKDIGYSMESLTADYCLSSHDHFDHNAVELVNAKVTVTDLSAVNSCGDIELSALFTYHDECKGLKRGDNLVYKFVVDGVKFAHLGDFGEGFSDDLVKRIGDVDVLFIPVGGTYTIDCETAVKYVNAIKPKIAVPMHYKTPRSNIDITDCSGFLKNFNEVVYCDKTFSLRNSELPDELTIFAFDKKYY